MAREATNKIKNTKAWAELSIETNDASEDSTIEEAVTKKGTYIISVLEYGIINAFFHDTYLSNKKVKGINVEKYGQINKGVYTYNNAFNVQQDHVYLTFVDTYEGEMMVHLTSYEDEYGRMCYRLIFSYEKGITFLKSDELFKDIKKIAFNLSRYKGKCLKVSIIEGVFQGIEIIDTKDFSANLILNDTQKRHLTHFVNRLKNKKTARYMFNGPPGCGKTHSIRNLIYDLTPQVTFIMPDFKYIDDLNIILEGCEIFDENVIVMDDIDLFLGSRDNRTQTNVLGQFLAFFDGVKKRKVSILASTNDKTLVDKAAERPGRFNMILDYGYLDKQQIIDVCKVHLPKSFHSEEIFNIMTQNVGGKKTKLTGAFIANFAENLIDMSEGNTKWTIKDTKVLFEESYKGFYSSQTENNEKMGFN